LVKFIQNISGKVAFAFSSAGGRLAQHAALAEVLMKGFYPGGKPIRYYL
jgi:hypothetical protein